MPFPEVKRVIYKKNPLDRVICQLRFSPILKIDAEIPAEFQDMIRADFPNYSEKTDSPDPFLKTKQFSLEL
ncbi:TIGR04255 family protein, partial [candidate division KSB1 bacterium]|nr:TIGR04255 family protein [candidate division KSB1 bacterium]